MTAEALAQQSLQSWTTLEIMSPEAHQRVQRTWGLSRNASIAMVLHERRRRG